MSPSREIADRRPGGYYTRAWRLRRVFSRRTRAAESTRGRGERQSWARESILCRRRQRFCDISCLLRQREDVHGVAAACRVRLRSHAHSDRSDRAAAESRRCGRPCPCRLRTCPRWSCCRQTAGRDDDLLAAFNLKRRAASGVRLPAVLRLNVDPTVSPPAVAGCAAVPLHLDEEQLPYACAAVDCQQARRRLECDG